MSDQLWLFVTVPTVTAFIGYVTNWAAVRMIFHPAEPRGIGPFRWQGIVYRMAPKFAREIANTTGQVLTPSDIVERVDIAGLVERLFEAHEAVLDHAVGESLDVLAPGAWASMDPAARVQVRTMLVAQATGSVDGMVEALGHRLPDILDLDALLVEELTGENAGRLARVSGEIAARASCGSSSSTAACSGSVSGWCRPPCTACSASGGRCRSSAESSASGRTGSRSR